MRITITTDGGITGRGIGRVSIDDATPLTRSQRDALDRAIAAARPQSWKHDYPHRGADLVRYTLTLDDAEASWVDAAAIPGDLRALFDAVWSLRS